MLYFIACESLRLSQHFISLVGTGIPGMKQYKSEDNFILLLMSCDCVSVLWLFLTVPLVGLQCVIVVYPDHTYFFILNPEVLFNS